MLLLLDLFKKPNTSFEKLDTSSSAIFFTLTSIVGPSARRPSTATAAASSSGVCRVDLIRVARLLKVDILNLLYKTQC